MEPLFHAQAYYFINCTQETYTAYWSCGLHSSLCNMLSYHCLRIYRLQSKTLAAELATCSINVREESGHARDYSRRNGAWFPAFVGVVEKNSRALMRAFYFGSLLFQLLNPPLYSDRPYTQYKYVCTRDVGKKCDRPRQNQPYCGENDF